MTDLEPYSAYNIYPAAGRDVAPSRKVRAVHQQAAARHAELAERHLLAREAEGLMLNLGNTTNQDVVGLAATLFKRQDEIKDARVHEVAVRNSQHVLNVVNGSALSFLQITGSKYAELLNADFQDPPEPPRGFWSGFVAPADE